MPIDHEEHSALLQAVADRLCAGLADRVKVRVDDRGQICLSCRTWSAAMTRTTFRDKMALAKARELIPQGTTGTSRRAKLMMKALLGEGLAVQSERHAAAEALGLTAQRRRSDLDPSRVLIDRQQKSVLLADGIDLHAAIRTMGKTRRWWVYRHNPLERVYLDVFEPEVAMLTIEQRGLGAPVLSAWQQVSGRTFYNGDTLDLNFPVPDTIAVAAAGRRLGDVFDTGSAALDERRISYMTTKAVGEPHGLEWTMTKIVLEPDLVEVGPPTR